jgi:hypothetical protein
MSQNRMTERALRAMLKSGAELQRLHVCCSQVRELLERILPCGISWRPCATSCAVIRGEGLRVSEEVEVLAKSKPLIGAQKRQYVRLIHSIVASR